MKKIKFLQKINSLKEFIKQDQVLELYSEAEEIFNDLEQTISDLKDKSKKQESEIEDLEEEVEGLEERIGDLESNQNFNIENPVHNNIRTVSALEGLFLNLDAIPVEAIGSLVKKYVVP